MNGSRGKHGFSVLTLAIPEALAKRLEAVGVDVEAMVVELLVRELGLDPGEEAAVRVELAAKYLEEGRRLVDRDPVQASEKLYKAAEEAVKALAIRYGLRGVLDRVRARGRWTVTDLSKAATGLAERVGSWLLDAWDHAWTLHVWGFHEARLDSEDVRARLPHIEKLVEYARREVQGRGQPGGRVSHKEVRSEDS